MNDNNMKLLLSRECLTASAPWWFQRNTCFLQCSIIRKQPSSPLGHHWDSFGHRLWLGCWSHLSQNTSQWLIQAKSLVLLQSIVCPCLPWEKVEVFFMSVSFSLRPWLCPNPNLLHKPVVSYWIFLRKLLEPRDTEREIHWFEIILDEVQVLFCDSPY